MGVSSLRWMTNNLEVIRGQKSASGKSDQMGKINALASTDFGLSESESNSDLDGSPKFHHLQNHLLKSQLRRIKALFGSLQQPVSC